MQTDNSIKEMVRDKYAQIALDTIDCKTTGCCGSHSLPEVYNIMSDDYTKLDGYVEEADLGLGCGLPTQYAKISEGDTVLDLGSGAGNDVFIARSIVGESGKVIGVDMTPEMISRARANAEKLGYTNVSFLLGEIEAMPVERNTIDVVVSNCVLNLIPNKREAFSEIFRVLKSGGHFSISDIVLKGELNSKLKEPAEMYAGCVAGAIQMEEYLSTITGTGFVNLRLDKQKKIDIPDSILSQYLDPQELSEYRNSDFEIISITVYAEKP